VKQPALVVEDTNNLNERLMLVVDKNGVIGHELINQLKNEGIVVYVSKNPPSLEQEESENIIYVPFVKKIPSIPENHYLFIFVVDDKDILREAVSSFLNKAREDKSTLVFITDLFTASEKLINELNAFYKNVKIIIHGDIFSADLSESVDSKICQLLRHVKRYGRIELPGDGTGLLFPTYKNYLIAEILEVAFGSIREEKVFNLFPQSGITYLSFAHLLQKKNPWIKVDFVKDKKENSVRLPATGDFTIAKHNNFADALKQIDFNEAEVIREKKEIKKDKKNNSQMNKAKKFPVSVFLFLIILLISLPLVSTLLLAMLGGTLLQSSKDNFSNGNLSVALSQAKIAQKTFTIASYSTKPLTYELSILNQKNFAESIESKIETGSNISLAAVSFFSASNSFVKVINNKTKNPKEDFINGINLIKNAISILQKETNKNIALEQFDSKIKSSLNFISSTIDLWPTLAGFDKAKTYLVLLQNNMELRPGGGFIGSYGLLTIEKGKVLDFQVNDVYDADGQLKADIEPQFPLRRYLAVKHLFLRDSNFDLDFRNVSSKAAMLFNLETGKKINGVIGVDLTVLKDILDVAGEVNVKDYNEEVNADNLFYITESHAEKNFFPGSTQKKDFLKSLCSAVVAKLSSEKHFSPLNLLNVLASVIEEKHLLFGFSNSSIQNLFTINGWSSAIWDERQQAAGEINDFLGINEANLGGNKANYFISRSVSQRVAISKENITEELTISYKNNSNNEWPGGDYKNYVRLILPQGTFLESIQIDGQNQKIIEPITDPAIYERKDFKAQSGLEVEQGQESGKQVLGFFTIIPKGKLVLIKIAYRLPTRISNNVSSFAYNLRIFKQPGIDSFPYDLVVEYPEDYRILDKTEGMVTAQDKVALEKNIVKDEDFSAAMVKK
jgi:hypothetical protein